MPAALRLSRTRGWRLAAVAAAMVVAFTGYGTLVQPRPYYLTDIDSEQDYYYNARLIASGLPETVHHPGTPVHYLAYGILSVSGDEVPKTQRFFDLSYLVIAIVTSLGLLAFGGLALRDESAGTAALALAAVLAWPPFLTYLTILGADSFIVAAGLPAIGLFWHVLHGRTRPSRATLLASGASVGLCLAVKMSFVPVAIALFAGYAVWAIRRPPAPGSSPPGSGVARSRPLILIGLGFVAGYLVAIAPVLGRVGVIWSRTANRPDVVPRGESLAQELGQTALDLFRHAPGWTVLAVSGCALAILMLGRAAGSTRSASRAPRDTDQPTFDLLAAGVAVALLLAALVYTAAASTSVSPGSAVGIRLRNMSPAALVVPLVILLAARAGSARIPARRATARWRSPGGVLAAIVVVAAAMLTDLGHRSRFITAHQERTAATQGRLAQLAQGTARLAFWTESDQDYLGAASFHFWGNYRYANQAYDHELVSQFPPYTFLRLRNLRRPPAEGEPGGKPPSRSRYGAVGDWYWTVRRAALADRPHYTSFPGGVAGESVERMVHVLALPEGELAELEGGTEAEQLTVLTSRFGAGLSHKERIGGVSWVLLELSPTGAPARAVTSDGGHQ
jgi:hypothetical protein